MAALIIDIEGITLTDADRQLLTHPAIAGVILFTRNYTDPDQLQQLVADIRSAAGRPVLITVDHEGGRVQRFRAGFTAIPPMTALHYRAADASQGQSWARELGWLMAAELLATGLDLSFAPVLDCQADSQVIGDRAFGTTPEVVVPLARAFIQGMNEAGMVATGKHFPGHGTVAADSHIAVPADERSEATIMAGEGQVFAALANELAAMMPAHVIYSQVSEHPAGFSAYWLQHVLRQQLGFKGVVVSDDLSMAGAAVAGTVPERVEQARAAGAELLLLCNDRRAVVEVLTRVTDLQATPELVASLQGNSSWSGFPALHREPRWATAHELARKLWQGCYGVNG